MSALDLKEMPLGSDPLALLERARYLARSIREGSAPEPGVTAQATGVGEKGDKGEKPSEPTRKTARPLEMVSGSPVDDPEVAWRLEIMRKQVPPSGAVPDLIAREAPIQPGTCFSCGEVLKGSQRYRCRPCAVAAAIAIWGTCPEDIASRLIQDEAP